jgi:hypothetical protein
MDVGISLLVYNFMRTSMDAGPATAADPRHRAPTGSPVRA